MRSVSIRGFANANVGMEDKAKKEALVRANSLRFIWLGLHMPVSHRASSWLVALAAGGVNVWVRIMTLSNPLGSSAMSGFPTLASAKMRDLAVSTSQPAENQ